MNKQPEVTEATRQRILDAFWRLFERNEIEAITINRLAAEAGIHRSSFYRYFPDIYAVSDSFENQLIAALRADINNISLAAETDFSLYAARVSEVLAARADKLYRLFHSSLSCAFRKLFTENLQEVVKLMYGFNEAPEDMDYYTALMCSILMANLSFWYENKTRYSFQEINAKCQLIIGEGLAKIHARNT